METCKMLSKTSKAGWLYSSVAQSLTYICKVLNLILSTAKKPSQTKSKPKLQRQDNVDDKNRNKGQKY